MSDKTTNFIALLLLSIMGLIAFASYQGDSLTMDELSHIPAGYSYVSQQDFRINPEHPPLIKDLAGFPLLFLDVNFPSDDAAWTEPVNGQWWYGWKLLFNSNNNADLMIFWARLPMIFILLSLGFILFWWVKKEFDKKTALLVLALFSFSPTLIAHGKLVTTDVGAALGFLIGIIAWIWLLRNPSLKNAFITGIAFGFCMLLKFSLVLLIPTVGIMAIVYALLHKKNLLYYIGLSVLAGIVGVIFMILPVYLFHVANYPVSRQLRDTQDLLSSSPMPLLRDIVVWMSDKPVLRALGHYFLGLLMATQRTAFGNTVYFLGMVSGSGWWYYFPVVYFLKTPLALHILTFLALALALWLGLKKAPWSEQPLQRMKNCISEHFPEFSMALFMMIYWGTSITGNLNIGVRHILPVFPFVYILISRGIIEGVAKIENPAYKKTVWYLVVALIIWYAFSSLSTFPHYIPYFSKVVGGTDNGYRYVVDSNYDWGQDLKRLRKWVDENNIQKIKIDYFGGADVSYYFGEKAERVDARSELQKGYLAISATHLMGGQGEPVPGYDQPTGYYDWLENYQPIGRAGKSIFIYYIE